MSLIFKRTLVLGALLTTSFLFQNCGLFYGYGPGSPEQKVSPILIPEPPIPVPGTPTPTPTPATTPTPSIKMEYNSSFLRNNIPERVLLGEPLDIELSIENTGRLNWDPKELFKLYVSYKFPQNPVLSSNDLINDRRLGKFILIPLEEPVKSGERYIFKFRLNAPMQTGTFGLYLKMGHYRENTLDFAEPDLELFGDTLSQRIEVIVN